MDRVCETCKYEGTKCHDKAKEYAENSLEQTGRYWEPYCNYWEAPDDKKGK